MYRIKYSLFWSPNVRGEVVIEASNERAAYLNAFNMLIKRFRTSVVIGAIKELRGVS
jgi:hypothetical protein